MPIPVDTTGYYNRSVDLMNRYKNLNFVRRATTPSLQKMTLPDPDNPKGNYMSHRMSYAEADGQYYAYPEVVQIGNKLQYMPGKKGMEYAFKNKQAIPLGSDKNFADYFTTVGYKYKFSPDIFNEAMKDYSKNTNIMKFIPKNKKGGIYIKPENRGKFTATKKKTGKTTEELTHSKNSLTRKRAIFAQNARKWHHPKKHQEGGNLTAILDNINTKNIDILNKLKGFNKEKSTNTFKFQLGGSFKNSTWQAPISFDKNTEVVNSVIPILDHFEGFKDKVYKDANKVKTIGHGLTAEKYINKGTITREESLEGVKEHLNSEVISKLKGMPYWSKLNKDQKTALASYVYNVGWGGFTKKSPKLQEALKNNDTSDIIKNLNFGYSDVKNPGLKQRRIYEQSLFTSAPLLKRSFKVGGKIQTIGKKWMK